MSDGQNPPGCGFRGPQGGPRVRSPSMCGGVILAAAGANVIMQMPWLPAGRGVAESAVESGRIDKHPLKRIRTTLT